MYEIWKDGACIAVIGEPVYIRRHEQGFYILCGEREAQGIVVNGTPYTLSGREPMPDTATVELQDAEYVTFGQLASAIREGVNGVDE